MDCSVDCASVPDATGQFIIGVQKRRRQYGGDSFTGGTDANILTGIGGSDTLNSFSGDDTLRGGLGDETNAFGTDAALEADVVEELLNQRKDTLNFAAIGIGVNLNLGITSVQPVHTDRMLALNRNDSFENATGGALAYILRGSALANSLVGNNGNDIQVGGRAWTG